ncbi:MAG TPA: formyltetrahydrofolate deformylase [Streptosporangiaceae bacterium]|nr:formyltetrahydrofolate deformylase [Streptosporangiaceae bacterium]
MEPDRRRAAPGTALLEAAAQADERYADTGRLVIACPDRPGIVAAVSNFLFQQGANITESQQFSTDPYSTDPAGGTFYLRMEFTLEGLAKRADELAAEFAGFADRSAMRWRLTKAAERKRMAIMVSRTDHVLQELLWRAHWGELRADIRMVISNHQAAAEAAAWWGVPFHYVPVTPQTKEEAETAQLKLVCGAVDLVVLARYMQILSPRFLSEFTGPVINIHHSFLPAFAGADPYQQAAVRGVKLIGATAHYVTAELDAGPIIEQDTVRVDHRCSVEDLRRMGRHVERAVLARAVGWHLEDRILVHQNKTIVFS